MTEEWLAITVGLLALMPGLLCLRNLRLFAPPPPPPRPPSPAAWPAISVLIPARNEAATIEAAVAAALASHQVQLEVIVLDDHSEDDTAARVRALADQDPRVRLASAPPLPEGWSGKQHACAVLADLAAHPLLVFLDADVRLAPQGLARLAAAMRSRPDFPTALLSGIPRQETGTCLERLIIPLIHFVLLAYLPLDLLRRSRSPAFGAGCGQLFMAEREPYRRCGGHRAIPQSFHDGLELPKAFRRAGFWTDLVDATEVASCRMYRGAREVWCGFAKNATEGMAAPARILPFTALLLGGQILPPLLLLVGWARAWSGPPLAWLGGATAMIYLMRVWLGLRFRQSWLGAALHPAGVAVLLAIQWYALIRQWLNQPATWKGRPAPARKIL